MMVTIKNMINKIISDKIEIDFSNNIAFINALHILLNGNFVKYNFCDKSLSLSDLSNDDFQKKLFKINEKTDKQKIKGVYYTPNDVSEYIIANSIINYINSKINKTINYDNMYDELFSLNKDLLKKILFDTKILDPTCGSGEFLINSLIIKINILKKLEILNDENLLKIVSTLYGNDIDDESTDISKIRLFFYISNLIEDDRYYKKIAKIMIKNFFNFDFVCNSNDIKRKFDIIVGNPPYVEYGKYENKELLTNNYGNIYADVIKNSIKLLKKEGVLGFIVPLSYVSTSRMSKIRNFVDKFCYKQILLSFADRPDCLFNGVHQKLNIIILTKTKQEKQRLVSNYKHWYKEERNELLNGREVLPSSYKLPFIPKIGNDIEKNIFDKVFTKKSNNLYDSQNLNSKPLYLNMRCCFWIKCFSFNPGSNEYKEFKYRNSDYMICLLNSSLFWLFWTIVSDCWHITSKELKCFKYIDVEDDFSILRKELEKQLDKTKKYVGSKQTEYEYKHKYCKKVIDKIDDKIAKIYNLTEEELNYIKNFAIKYRMGGLDEEN